LLFDENSEQSKMLMDNGTFKAYYNKYLSCMKEVISEASDVKEIDIEAIYEKLSTKLGNPNFSNSGEINDFDYYGLMGGTQNIDIDLEISPASNGEYNLKTTMNINDWYGADKDDINKHVDFKDALEDIGKTLFTPNPMDSYIIPYLYIKEFNLNKKSFIPGLDDFFWLQHHYGCKPFPIQIIYKSEDKIDLAN
ncbi:MAG: hypothetical protein R3Y04_01810, partial [Rikenellaceae bacterium]